MFDEQLPRLQEWDLWIRISKYYLFRLVDEPLVNAHFYMDSISFNKKAHPKARELILEKHFEEFLRKPKLLIKLYFEIGILFCLNGEIKKGMNYIFKPFKKHHFNIKLILSFFSSFLNSEFILRIWTYFFW